MNEHLMYPLAEKLSGQSSPIKARGNRIFCALLPPAALNEEGILQITDRKTIF